MKVVVVGKYHEDGIEFHLSETLKLMEYQVFVVNLNQKIFLTKNWGNTIRKSISTVQVAIDSLIYRKIISCDPELVLITSRSISPNIIKRLKKNTTAPLVHINPDALTTFQRQEIFASPYDFYFTKDPYIVRFMKEKLELPAHYLPEAFNAHYHKIPEQNREELQNEVNIDVLVFGNLYPYRTQMVKKLLDPDINIKLYGNKGFFMPKSLSNKYQNQYLIGKDKSKIIIGSKIVFNNLHYAEINSVNCKFFEIMGIGGFQLCDYRSILKEYTSVDINKFTFKSIGEAKEKIDYYLREPKERMELANIMYKEASESHTYEHRLTTLLKIVLQ